MLGHSDLKLNIKMKGDTSYKRLSVKYFGKLPNFNFTKISAISPGSSGERRYGRRGEEGNSRKRPN